MRLSSLNFFILTCCALVLTACGYQPEQPQVNLHLSSEWQALTPSQTAEFTQPNNLWWQAFATPTLNELIDQALAQSPDMLIAQQRLRQAQAQLGITKAKTLPELNASAGAGTGTRKTANTSFTSTESSSLGLSTSYEIDLWGRVAAEKHASAANLASAEYDWHSTRLSLTAAVASSWFRWLTLQEQLTNAKWYLAAAEKQLQLIEFGYQQGINTKVDVARQTKQVLSRQASVKKLEQQVLESRQALALLLGQPPQTFQPPAGQLLSIQTPIPNPGLPAEILSRRPDLASAEAKLDAAAANVFMARKAIYPQLSLGASANLASSRLNFNDPTQSLNLAANLTYNIFDFGTRRQQLELSRAQQEELLLSYAKNVYTALAEVEAALNNQQVTQELETQQRQLVATNKFISQKLESLYRAGAEKLSNLLDAQQEELQAQDQLLSLYLERLEASLTLYKVLGGSWP